MTHSRQLVARAKPQGRSRTTNGAQLLQDVDGRSTIARRFWDLLQGYEEEYEVATEAEHTLARQAANPHSYPIENPHLDV